MNTKQACKSLSWVEIRQKGRLYWKRELIQQALGATNSRFNGEQDVQDIYCLVVQCLRQFKQDKTLETLKNYHIEAGERADLMLGITREANYSNESQQRLSKQFAKRRDDFKQKYEGEIVINKNLKKPSYTAFFTMPASLELVLLKQYSPLYSLLFLLCEPNFPSDLPDIVGPLWLKKGDEWESHPEGLTFDWTSDDLPDTLEIRFKNPYPVDCRTEETIEVNSYTPIPNWKTNQHSADLLGGTLLCIHPNKQITQYDGESIKPLQLEKEAWLQYEEAKGTFVSFNYSIDFLGHDPSEIYKKIQKTMASKRGHYCYLLSKIILPREEVRQLIVDDPIAKVKDVDALNAVDFKAIGQQCFIRWLKGAPVESPTEATPPTDTQQEVTEGIKKPLLIDTETAVLHGFPPCIQGIINWVIKNPSKTKAEISKSEKRPIPISTISTAFKRLRASKIALDYKRTQKGQRHEYTIVVT